VINITRGVWLMKQRPNQIIDMGGVVAHQGCIVIDDASLSIGLCTPTVGVTLKFIGFFYVIVIGRF